MGSPESAAAPTSPTPPTPRAAETAARRRRLLEAAVELANEGGYDAVQMRDVAARAQVALGTLYRHYSSKDQLLLAALADQANTLSTRLALRPPRGEEPGDRVADVLRRATRALTRDPAVTAAMVTALSSPGSEAATAKREVYDILRAIISSSVDGAQVPDLDGIVRVLGYVWLATLGAWVGGMIDPDAMAADLAIAAHLLLDHGPTLS
jgi:TetR/AcrR family transcriptional regulator, cholesterol catabolism regulator